MKFFFPKFEIFYENHPPTRHIKYKRIHFALCNKSIMANKLRSTNVEQFIRRTKSPLYALIARIISRVNCPKLVKMAIFKPS